MAQNSFELKNTIDKKQNVITTVITLSMIQFNYTIIFKKCKQTFFRPHITKILLLTINNNPAKIILY